MKRVLLILLSFLFIFTLCSCGSKGEISDFKYDEDALVIKRDGSSLDGEVGEASGSTGETQGDQTEETIEPHQLTSSAYFDNDYFDFWKNLLVGSQEDSGSFNVFYKLSQFNPYYRVMVTLEGIEGAKVSIDDEFSGVTNANGVVYLFPNSYKDKYNIKIEYTKEDGSLLSITKEITGDTVISKDELEDSAAKAKKIELAFAIDTTGSMGDELDFLKSELKNVIERVRSENSDVLIYLALIFYRDQGDEYVTRVFDFSQDIDQRITDLSKQEYDGGGDFPEAIAEAFKEVNKLQWSDNATKLLVHVADAKDHPANMESYNNEVLAMAKKGIRIITVASSGIDKETEYIFRSECIITGGVYGYLTNDSGIGGDHIEATTQEKMVVEYLDDMLVRLINGFYTGTFSDPVPWQSQENQSK